jgi:hypothetical protein
MALFVAVASGVIRPNRPIRAANCCREACISSENVYFAVRLQQNETNMLTFEYIQWRQQTKGIRMRFHYGTKRIMVFLHYIAKGGYYRQLGRSEGLSESTTMGYLHDVSAFFQHTAAR